ncbi:hypothetical protein ABPG74_000644 [Tetrahymena malaccensis]
MQSDNYRHYYIPNGYQKIKYLGRGSQGQVYLIKKLDDNSLWVLKNIQTSQMSEKEKKKSQDEYKILRKLSNPHIIKFKEAICCNQREIIQIIMEYADGEDLDKKIQKQKKIGKPFSEEFILDVFVQIGLGLEHMHKRNVIHRDLKPLNIFFQSKQNKYKIGDFGVSKQLQFTNQLLTTQIGSPYYLAPEIILGTGYSFSVDIWSLGVILYELCCLQPPFDSWHQALIYLQAKNKPYPPIIQKEYSKDLKSLISKMLRKNPETRCTLKQIFDEPIIQNKIQNMLNQAKSRPNPQRIYRPHRHINLPNLQQPLGTHNLIPKKNNIQQQNIKIQANVNINQNNNQQNAIRPDSSANKQEQGKLKSEFIRRKSNQRLFLNNQSLKNDQNIQPQTQKTKQILPVEKSIDVKYRNPFLIPNNRQHQLLSIDSTPSLHKTFKFNQISNIKQNIQSQNQLILNKNDPKNNILDNIEREKEITRNKKNPVDFDDTNSIEITNQNISNNQTPQQAQSYKKLQSLPTENSTRLSRRGTYQSTDDDSQSINNKNYPQKKNPIDSAQNKKIATPRKSTPSQKINQKIKDNDFLSSNNKQKKIYEELNEEINENSPLKLKHEMDSTNKDDIQKQSQKNQVKELNTIQTNLNNNDTNSYEKQEKLNNQQNIEKKQINHDYLLGTPQPDSPTCIQKLNEIAAEQNKIANISYIMQNPYENQNQLEQNDQSVQIKNDKNLKIEKEIEELKQQGQIKIICAKSVNKSKRQNTLNDMSQNLNQVESIPVTPIKKKISSDQQDQTKQQIQNSDEQKNISNEKYNTLREQQGSSNELNSCQLISQQKEIYQEQSSQHNSSYQNTSKLQIEQVILNEVNKEDDDIQNDNQNKQVVRRISFETAQSYNENANFKQKLPSFFDRKQENIQTQAIKLQSKKQNYKNNIETFRSNQTQDQLEEKESEQNEQRYSDASFEEFYEDTQIQQQSEYINYLSSLIKSDQSKRQDNHNNEHYYNHLKTGENYCDGQNQYYEDDDFEKYEEEIIKQKEEEEEFIYLIQSKISQISSNN